jgi:hypothetical protein
LGGSATGDLITDRCREQGGDYPRVCARKSTVANHIYYKYGPERADLQLDRTIYRWLRIARKSHVTGGLGAVGKHIKNFLKKPNDVSLCTHRGHQRRTLMVSFLGVTTLLPGSVSA